MPLSAPGARSAGTPPLSLCAMDRGRFRTARRRRGLAAAPGKHRRRRQLRRRAAAGAARRRRARPPSRRPARCSTPARAAGLRARGPRLGAGRCARRGATESRRSKATADAHLRGLPDLELDDPASGSVLANAVHGGSAMLRGLAGLPLVTPVIGADGRMQVDRAPTMLSETVAVCARARIHRPRRCGRWRVRRSRLGRDRQRSAPGSVLRRRRYCRCPTWSEKSSQRSPTPRAGSAGAARRARRRLRS